jgi:predicted DCC family thiol-disulfide oxidoreductase YuxK
MKDEIEQLRGVPILFYDGVCGLCNRLVRFVLRRDPGGKFRFASLQSGFARRVLVPRGKDPGDLDTVHLLLDPGGPGERVLSKGRAAFEVLRILGGPLGALSVLRFLPGRLLDWGYDRIARRRYRWFGRYESCPLPDPRHKDRFIEI